MDVPLKHGDAVTVEMAALQHAVSGIFNRMVSRDRCEILLVSGASLITNQRHVQRVASEDDGVPLIGLGVAVLSGAGIVGLAWWLWG